MAVRTVSVLLTADIAAFRARMGEASRQSQRTSRDIRASMRRAGDSMNRLAEGQRNALKATQAASVGLIAVFGLAVYAAAKFEKSMAQVKAVTGASAGQMAVLRSAALEAGRTTAYSATQAAEAQLELAKAGISVSDISGGALKGTLNLAAAAEIDVAEGAEIAANAMTVFGLKGRDVGHVADVLAAAANKSTTDVHQLGLSLRMTGQVASQTGLGLEDTVGALALFASEGLKGSDAGTSLKVMLQRLTPQSKEAAELMERLGFSAYDANGNFIGLQAMAGRMKDAFSGLTPEARNAAMGVIFGSDAVRAANIIYKYGEEGVRKYTDAVNDQGYAAQVAKTRMDHLMGDLQLLKSSLEVALIQSGSAANSVLREMVQWVTRLVNIYNGLPPALQQSATLMAGFAGALGLAGASLLLFLPRVMLVRRELVALGVTAARVRGSMMLLGKMGLVVGSLAAISWGVNKLTSFMGDAPPNVTKLTNSLIDLARTERVAGEAAKVFGSDLDGFGEAVARIAHPGSLERVNDSLAKIFNFGLADSPKLDEARKKLQAFDEALANMVSSGAPDTAALAFRRMAKEAEAQGTSTEKLRGMLPKYGEALAAMGAQNKLGAEAQGQLGDATAMTADELADQRSAAEKLTDALNELNGVAISAAEGQIEFESSLDDLTKAVRDNGTSLDVNSEKGRNVKSAFLDSAKAAQEYAQKVADQKGSVEAGNAVLETNISKLRRTMKAAGFTSAQIDKLIGTYARLPPKTETQIVAETQSAMKDLQAVRNRIKTTKGKRLVMEAPTGAAIRELERLGFKIRRTKGKRVIITAPTGSAQSSVASLQRRIDALRDKEVTISITRYFRSVGNPQGMKNALETRAGGGLVGGYAGGGSVRGYPTGGQVYGPGSETSDSIPAWLSNNEYVIRAAAVRKYGVGLFDRLNTMRFASGGLAKGGKAKKTTPVSVQNARRELPGDLGAFTRSLNKSASDISSASKSLITDLKKLGKVGWRLAGDVERTSRKLQNLARERDRASERLKEARGYAADRRGSMAEFLSMGAAGDVQNVNFLIEDLNKRRRTASGFTKQVRDLEKRGLNDAMLRELIEAGPDSDLARILSSADASQIKRLNEAAKANAKLSKKFGRMSADMLYDAGKDASKGFLAGLESQEKALQKQMDKLGKSLVKSIKKALDSHSPSRKTMAVGRDLGAGLTIGMDQSVRHVKAAAGRVSAAAIPDGALLSGRQFTGRTGMSGASLGPITAQLTARVYVGDREITDIVRTEVDADFGALATALGGRRLI